MFCNAYPMAGACARETTRLKALMNRLIELRKFFDLIRVTGKIVQFYTLKAQSPVNGGYLE
jgi:hypothetical protein